MKLITVYPVVFLVIFASLSLYDYCGGKEQRTWGRAIYISDDCVFDEPIEVHEDGTTFIGHGKTIVFKDANSKGDQSENN